MSCNQTTMLDKLSLAFLMLSAFIFFRLLQYWFHVFCYYFVSIFVKYSWQNKILTFQRSITFIHRSTSSNIHSHVLFSKRYETDSIPFWLFFFIKAWVSFWSLQCIISEYTALSWVHLTTRANKPVSNLFEEWDREKAFPSTWHLEARISSGKLALLLLSAGSESSWQLWRRARKQQQKRIGCKKIEDRERIPDSWTWKHHHMFWIALECR